MFAYFGLGVLALGLVLMLARAAAHADPAKLAGGLKMALAASAAIAVIAFVVVLLIERSGIALAVIGGLAPLGLRAFAAWRRRQAVSGPPPGQASEVETDFLHMHLDHETGAMSGSVRRGRFQGRDLGDLTRGEVVELWHECRVADAPSGKLLEAYLDRAMPGWRDTDRSQAGGPGGEDAMTREEACEVLGLDPSAGEAEIRAAYQRLMAKIRTGKGGSTYLTDKINRARDVLLG